MNTEEYLNEIKSIQSEFLEFIEDDENVEENFQNLCSLLENKKIRDNKHDLKLFLHHIASVCVNHHRGNNFFGKIERVLQIFKDDIKKYCINSEIFNIFKHDKRILLFLVEEKILIFDEYVAKAIIRRKYVIMKYPHYFAPEIKTFVKEKWFPKYYPKEFISNEWVEEIKKELPANFYELRRIGENESYICQLIRDDNARDFIAYVNQNNYRLDLVIGLSIYETNSFLIKKKTEFRSNGNISLMEYAAFFGSIQIIKHLKMEGIELNTLLWNYVVHSQSAELIHFLEDCHIEPTMTLFTDRELIERKLYDECYIESIQCNHNAMADYFLNNYIQNCDQISNDAFIQSLEHYNFQFIQKEHVDESSFCRLCQYDYYFLVDNLLANKGINVNIEIIKNHIFRLHSKMHFSIGFKIISFNEIQNHIFQ